MNRPAIERITSWFGNNFSAGSRLAFIDMALVSTANAHVLALVEIEETGGSPKLILGNALATLLGDSITFGDETLLVGPWTTLAILVRSRRRSPPAQWPYLEDQLRRLKPCRPAGNASIGEIVIEAWDDEEDLLRRLISLSN